MPLDSRRLGVDRLLSLAVQPRLGHERLGRGRIPRAARRTDLLGQVVDGGADAVPFRGEFAQLPIELHRLVELAEDVGFSAPRKGVTNGVGLRTQHLDVDHDHTGYC